MRTPLRSFSVVALTALWLVCSPGAAQQDGAGSPGWSDAELRDRSQGFLQPGIRAELAQIGTLLASREAARGALEAAIHGDHREYTLKIGRYLDQLADPRWLTREDAERTLIEIGARALAQIETRALEGATLEERIRSQRIIEAIVLRGTEEERNETRLLQGWTSTAAYLSGSARLEAALRSALGHTDALVVENALNALGAIGSEAALPLLAERIAPGGAPGGQRQAALEALGLAVRRPAARELAVELLREPGRLSRTEAVALLADLRAVPEGAAAVTGLATAAADAAVRALAAVELAPRTAGGSFALRATLQLADRDEVVAEIRELRGSDLVASGVVESLDAARLRHGACPVVALPGAPAELPADSCRVFLEQGSLIVGALRGADAEVLNLGSPLFGDVALPRDAIQGLALDPAVDRLVGAATGHERIRTRDERMIDAHIEAIDAQGVRYRPAGEDGAEPVVIPLADVVGILFRRPTEVTPSEELFTRLDLASGDRLLAHVGGLGGDQRLAVWIEELGAARVPLDAVRRIEFDVGGGALWGFTLIADYSENRVIEVDEQGEEVFAFEEIYGAWDAECLENGNLLITEFALNRVSEMTREGDVVWEYDDLKNPYDADALPNGNVLIADTFGERVVEVNRDGEIVWKYEGVKPYDADRLPNGNTLIADSNGKRVIEVSPDGEVVWERGDLLGVHDADRLANGNTLITLRTKSLVIEVDRSGKVIFEIRGLSSPSDADRLPNGHTIVAENGGVREFNRRGEPVWELEAAWAVEVNRY